MYYSLLTIHSSLFTKFLLKTNFFQFKRLTLFTFIIDKFKGAFMSQSILIQTSLNFSALSLIYIVEILDF